MWTMRSPKSKTRLSCVTTMTARPGCTATRFAATPSPSGPTAASSAAVGSSHTSSRGSWTRPRAMATRCCWPPDSCDGQDVQLVARVPTASSIRLGLGDGLAPRHPGDEQRHGGVLGRRQGRQQVVLLEHEADVLAAELHQPPCHAVCAGPRPARSTRPSVGSSSPAMIEISVVLPQPDWPTSSVIWPAETSRSTPRRARTRGRRRRTPWSGRGR